MINRDEQELNKFSSIANEWWNPNGPFKPLHDLNPYRMGFIEQQVDLADKVALDVGCGGGILTESLAIRGAHASGIDLSAESIEAAKIHAKSRNLAIQYHCISVEELAAKEPGKYDVVTCMELLEHVPNPQSVIEACAKLCKPNGKLFFSTLNRNPKAFLLGIVAAEYILNLVPRGTHDYQKFIKPAELCEWCRQAGLEVNLLQGLHFNPLTKRFRIVNDISVNYLAYVTKPSK